MEIGGGEVVFTDNSAEILKLMKGASEKAAREIGGKIVNHAREAVDKARGPLGNAWPQESVIALRQSLVCRVKDTDKGPVLYVGSNLEIAPYIELGTGKEYDPPEAWIEYHGHDGHTKAGLDSWIYFDELDGEFKLGRPVPPTPYLSPAVLDHAAEYKKVLKQYLKNADGNILQAAGDAADAATTSIMNEVSGAFFE